MSSHSPDGVRLSRMTVSQWAQHGAQGAAIVGPQRRGQGLRAENPEWGVRDIADLNTLAQSAGLTAAEITPMPANNLVLAFTRAVRHN
jgi:hypothetical protein